MKLFHHTSVLHLPKIMTSNRLKMTESNLREYPTKNDPKVVWLSEQPDADIWTRSSPAKRNVRFAISATERRPGLMRWHDFATKYGCDARFTRSLITTGGDPTKWWVSTTVIWREEWLTIDLDGEVPIATIEGWTTAHLSGRLFENHSLTPLGVAVLDGVEAYMDGQEIRNLNPRRAAPKWQREEDCL